MTDSWKDLDWAALDRLRDLFLSGQPKTAYWTSKSDLASYDFTFGQRIAWKWNSVLRELRQRAWTPPAGPLLDWGCGSGVASRQVIRCFGPAHFRELRLFDHSAMAVEFATEIARKDFSPLPVGFADQGWMERHEPIGVLVVSHVLNELDEAGGRALRRVLDRADAVLWVEPGTWADSRALIAMRESVREQFQLIAPCTHQASCGLLMSGNDRHWCHHFAAPPPGIMGNSDWVRFARRAGIDLRSVPYSYLVLERRGLRPPGPATLPDGWSRVLGEPRVYKGFARLLSCQSDGAYELELQKRDVPDWFKMIKNGSMPKTCRWTVSEKRIKGAGKLP